MKQANLTLGLAILVAAAAGCEKKQAEPAAQPEKPAVVLKGVDAEKRIVTMGALNDESGPAAAIGKPYALGKRILMQQVNAGGSGVLPEGWTLQLVERDHGYNPQRSVQLYNEIKENMLMLGTSFGTPNTLPLRPMLERDGVVAFPASLSSKMAEFAYTPPIGPTYVVETMRAMDWVVETAGGAGNVKAAIVYQQDDYGADGLEGWKKAAAHHGVEIVSSQEIAPGQSDFTAVLTALKQAGATHVLLTVLPSATGPILGTAAQLKFAPVWIGNAPAWIDRFFDTGVVPSAIFANFYWAQGMAFWGEDLPGMANFISAYEIYGASILPPDTYILLSYIQGAVALHAFSKAIEAGDLTRAGYLKALRSISDYNLNGMGQPIDFSQMPYVVGTQTRVLKPDFANRTWTTVAPYATPLAMQPAAAPTTEDAQ